MRIKKWIGSITLSLSLTFLANSGFADIENARMVPEFSTHYQEFQFQPFGYTFESRSGKLYVADYLKFEFKSFDLDKEMEESNFSEIQNLVYNGPDGLGLPYLMALNKSRSLIALVNSQRQVLVVDLLQKLAISKFQLEGAVINKIAFDNQNRLVVLSSGSDGSRIESYDILQRRLLSFWNTGFTALQLRLTDNDTVVWTSDGYRLFRVDLKANPNSALTQFQLDQDFRTVQGIDFNESTQQIAVGILGGWGRSPRIDILNLRNPSEVTKSINLAAGSEAHIVRLSSDGAFLHVLTKNHNGFSNFIPKLVTINTASSATVNEYEISGAPIRDLFVEPKTGKVFALGRGLWVMDTGLRNCVAPTGVSALEDLIKEQSETIASLNEEIASRVNEAKVQLAAKDVIISNLQNSIAETQEQNRKLLAEKNSKIKSLESEIAALKSSLASKEATIRNLESQKLTLVKSLADAESMLNQFGCRLVKGRYSCPKKLLKIVAARVKKN